MDERKPDEAPDLAHADAADGMVGTPSGGNVGETPRGWASYGASRHLPDGLAERNERGERGKRGARSERKPEAGPRT